MTLPFDWPIFDIIDFTKEPYKNQSKTMTHLLLGDLKGFKIVADNSQFLLEFDNLGLTGLCPLFGALEVGLNHGQLSGDLT